MICLMCGHEPELDPDMDRRFEVTIWSRDRSSHLEAGGPDPWHPIDTFYVAEWCRISGALKRRSESERDGALKRMEQDSSVVNTKLLLHHVRWRIIVEL